MFLCDEEPLKASEQEKLYERILEDGKTYKAERTDRRLSLRENECLKKRLR